MNHDSKHARCMRMQATTCTPTEVTSLAPVTGREGSRTPTPIPPSELAGAISPQQRRDRPGKSAHGCAEPSRRARVCARRQTLPTRVHPSMRRTRAVPDSADTPACPEVDAANDEDDNDVRFGPVCSLHPQCQPPQQGLRMGLLVYCCPTLGLMWALSGPPLGTDGAGLSLNGA